MMSYLEHEASLLRKARLLPHLYKRIGGVLTVVFILLFVISAFVEGKTLWFKALIMHGLLVSMLLISISRDAVEDEYIVQLRGQSYVLAFICGVIYAIFQPYINYGVAWLIMQEGASFALLDSYVVIWFMLFVQLGFFHLLKATR